MENKFVVAIGSSAGGQEPLFALFNSTPHDNVTYIILRHLPRQYRSQFQTILQVHSKLNVVEVVNGMAIENDTVYMAPDGMYMTIENDKLYLQDRPLSKPYPNASVDVFLASLAKAKGKKSIAIILSGAGGDGSKGAFLIKEAGGMVIVQKPNTCEYPGMPLSTIESGAVDYILDVLDMSEAVLKHASEIIKDSNDLKG